MTRDEFLDRLDRYGADLDAWPRREVEGARRRLVHDLDTQRDLAVAQRLHEVLAAEIAPPPQSTEALVAFALRRRQEQRAAAALPLARRAGWAAAAAVVFAIGVGVGALGSPSGSTIDAELAIGPAAELAWDVVGG